MKELNELKIAAVVVTYNRLELLKECIEALKNQTRKLDRIYIINNSSTDGTQEWLKIQEEITVITQPNSGSSGGQYTGIKTAFEDGFDWIWCMDDDSEAYLNSLEKLVSFINKKSLVLAPKVVDEKNNILFEHRGYFNLNRIIKGDIQTPSQQEKYRNNYFDVDFASFVGIFINKEIIARIGYPNKDFFIYHDDVEYSFRIKTFSQIGVVSESVIVHKISSKNNIVIKKKMFWTSYRPRLSSYGIQCICYRNLFYLFLNYSPKKYLGILNVLYNYFVLLRRIIFFDENKYFRISKLNKALQDAVKSEFNNKYFLTLKLK